MTTEERLAVLEAQYEHMSNQQSEIVRKLDDLIALRNKGTGAFLLASALLGTGIIGVITQIFEWMKGVTH